MRQNCFENWNDYSADIPYGSKILLKSLYLAQFSRYKHFCVFSIFAKNSKWPSFLVRQKFFENWDDYSADIPCGLKASSKTLSVVRCSRYKLLHILQFFAENSKWSPYLTTEILFENWDDYSADIPYRSKISSKSLSQAQFSRYKHFCVL